MDHITQTNVDDLVRSLMNYYLLVRSGILVDNSVNGNFLKAICEIERKGPAIFDDN